MARIIVDIDKEGLYQFFVKRDSNRTVATSCLFANKGICMDAIASFRDYAKEKFYWSYEVSVNGNYYAVWRKDGVQVTTKHYMFHRDLFAVVKQIQEEVSFKTPIFHTTIKNENYVRTTL